MVPNIPVKTSSSDGICITQAVPEDIWVHILSYLEVKETLSLRLASRRLDEITRIRSVWYDMLFDEIAYRDLPLVQTTRCDNSNSSLSNLSAQQLEEFTKRSLLFYASWESPAPTRKRERKLRTGCEKVPKLSFLQQHDSGWLLSVGYSRLVGRVVVQIWDLDVALEEGEVRCVDSIVWKDCRVLKVVVNSGERCQARNGRSGVLAASIKEDHAMRMDVYAFRGDDSKLRLTRSWSLDTPSHVVHAFRDNLVVLVNSNDAPGVGPVIHDLESGKVIRLGSECHDRCLHVLILDGLVLLFRETALEFFRPSLSTQDSELKPISIHQWTWRINSLAVSERVSWKPSTRNQKYNPLSIVIRFDSFFPWPVNAIHHFVLHPFSTSRFGKEDGKVLVPYVLPPTLHSTMTSSVRLFARSDMTVSKYGTILWLDSEGHAAEEWSGGVDGGQRVAGKRVGLGLGESENLNEREVFQNARAPSLFGNREADGWTTIAMDEERGRVAVGGDAGVVEIWDYF